MEGASGSWNPPSLTRRWRMGPRPAGERVGFGRREYRAGDKKRQRSVHLLRSRSITPRRGCFAKRGTAALEGELPMVECDRSCGLDVHRARTWGRIASNGGLAWSGHSRGFGFEDPRAVRLRPNRSRAIGRSQSAPRRDESISATKTLRKRRTRSALGKSNGSEGAQASSRLQKSVRGTLPARVEGSREANQARAG